MHKVLHRERHRNLRVMLGIFVLSVFLVLLGACSGNNNRTQDENPPTPTREIAQAGATATRLAQLPIGTLGPVIPILPIGPIIGLDFLSLTSMPQIMRPLESLPETAGGAEQEAGIEPDEPVQVAAAMVQIRDDVSGDLIGNGTIRVFAPETAAPASAFRVELEVLVDTLYATPTPRDSSATDVPRVTSTPSSAETPRSPLYSESGLELYQRMGATLFCSASSFTGCDSGRNAGQARLLNGTLTRWTWFLTAAELADGPQALRLDVWLTRRNLDGSLEFLDAWDYAFEIRVGAAGTTGEGFSPLLIVAAGLVLILLVAGLWRVVGTVPLPRDKDPRPLVFISYRRRVSWALARSVANSLQERGANVFIDIDDINEGRFAEIIEKSIEKCDYFVPLLAPGSLDSEWVCREIRCAIDHDKNIVPLLMDGYVLSAETLPADIRQIASHNAITILPEFYQEVIDRLATRFLKLE